MQTFVHLIMYQKQCTITDTDRYQNNHWAYIIDGELREAVFLKVFKSKATKANNRFGNCWQQNKRNNFMLLHVENCNHKSIAMRCARNHWDVIFRNKKIVELWCLHGDIDALHQVHEQSLIRPDARIKTRTNHRVTYFPVCAHDIESRNLVDAAAQRVARAVRFRDLARTNIDRSAATAAASVIRDCLIWMFGYLFLLLIFF